MPYRIWRPNIGGIRHTVVARWSPWTYEGEVILDIAVIKTWGTRPAGAEIDFQIEGHPACLRNTITTFDLYVEGEKVPYI